MASHSNRSPSPILSRPNNPNSRTLEIHSTTRGSFTGTKPSALANPRKSDSITPANSPSGFARRRSVGDTGDAGFCRRNFEEKENDVVKDQTPKASKLQSPAKGFMAPTISASSKIIPSPRKRVLVERNEAVRTSISLSDGKAVFFSNNSKDIEHKPVHDSKPSKKVSFHNMNESLPDPVISHPDSTKIELDLPIAPLDADPSKSPYDPETNYLSLRPQFLHYKPNPRVEVLLNKEKETGPNELKPLEDADGDDSFWKEDVSDYSSSGSKVSQDSEKDALEDIDSAGMVTRFEADDICVYDEVTENEILKAVASADIIEGLDFSEDDLNVSSDFGEDKMESIVSADEMVASGTVQSSENLNFAQKNEKKSRGACRLRCFSIVMMMLLTGACVSVSVTRYPSFEEFNLLKDLSSSDLGKFYHQSRVVATNNANVVWETCLSFVSKVANELSQGDKMPGPLKFVNLYDLPKNISGDDVEDDDDDDELDNAMGYFEEEYVDDDDDANVEEYADGVYECDEGFEDEVSEQEDGVSDIEEKVYVNSSDLDPEYPEDTRSPGDVVPSCSSSSLDEVSEIEETVLSELSELDSEHREDTQSPTEIIPISTRDQESEIVFENEAVPSETVVTETYKHDVLCGSDATTLMDQESMSDAESLTEKSSKNSVTPSEDKVLAYYGAGISSFIIAALSAVAVFTYQYKKTEKQKVHQEEKTEVDEDSSCPSEMSSFSPYNNSKKEMMRGASEVQSSEAKTRRHYATRESLASSSSEYTMGSPSYGSFTTFEKIPIKNGNGEEEIVTPVRRSSRIRTQQFTSPTACSFRSVD